MNHVIAVVLSANSNGFKAQMTQASGAVKGFEKDVQGTSTKAGNLAKGLKTAFAGLAVAAALFFANAIGQAIAFEGAMRNVNSISYLSEKQLASLGNQVLALSTRVPQSAKDLAEGLYDIASSGFQGAEGMKVLEASALAASAGITTTAVSAKAIAQVLNAYGLQASEAADVSDVLFATVNLGVVSFEELATQLGDVVGGASAAGIAIDEVGAAVAAMTLSGLGAAEATTSLNQLIRALIKPSDGLAAAYQNLGIESGAAALEEKGLHGVMELLRDSTGGNIVTLLKLFPEIRAARGAFALMAADGQNYAKTFTGIADETNRAGATQKAFNEQMKGLGQQWKLFVNQINAGSIKIGLAILPTLKTALVLTRELGGNLVTWFKSVAAAATPTFRRIYDAALKVVDVIKELGKTVAPVATGLAKLAGVAVIGALSGLAMALESVAGFLADHPALIQAVALAYGGILVGRLITAVGALIQVKAGLLGVRAGLAALSAQSVLQELALRLSFVGDSFYALFSMGNMKNIGSFKTAFEGLGPAFASAATAITGAGVLLAIYAVQTGMSKAEQQAKDLRKELEKDIDFDSLAGIQAGVRTLREEYEETVKKFDDMGGRLGRTWKAFKELATPAENTVLDTKKAMEELGDATQDAAQAESNMWSATNQLKAEFGLTQSAAEAMLAEIDFDPTKELDMQALMDKVRGIAYEAAAATPELGGLHDATETVADITSTAADKVGALEDALKGLFGIAISAREAEAKLAGSIAELNKSVHDNGLTFDVWTEKGRENEDALRGNIEAILDLANATAAETGSVEDGVNVLSLYRQQLINNLTQMGMTKGAAEDLLATYGLTPENLSTLVTLEGTDSAQAALGDIEGMMKAIGDAKATGRVNLNTEDFDGNAEAITQWIEQIAVAAPEATVTLDNEPFKATAEQVDAWSTKYDNSSPEAEALLNIIDPTHKYTSLSQAAAYWGDTRSTGIANLDDQAAVPLSADQRRLNAWNNSRGTATVDVNDQASGTLSGIIGRLNTIANQSWTATVNVAANVSAAAQAASGHNRRWGGIHEARNGLAYEAGVYTQPTIFFGERETGGEAMIPRLGNRTRSLGILDKAAGWYGMEMSPRGSNSTQYMGQATNNISISVGVQVRADAGVDTTRLAKQVGKAVDQAVDTKMVDLKKLLRVR